MRRTGWRVIDWPRLSPSDVATFEAERQQSEDERGPRNAIIAATVHAAFGLAEPAVVPDVAVFALVLRLGVVVPLLLLALPVCTALHRTGRSRANEVVKAGMALVVVGSLAAVMVMSSSPSASAYFSGIFPVMIFFALTLRVRLHLAVGTLLAMALVAVLGTAGSPVLSHDVKFQVGGIFLASAALLAVMLVSRESDLRRSFVLRSRLRDANAELERLTEVDELTRVPNRRALVGLMQQWDAHGTWGAVAMIDVDHFKSVNDRFGHAEGDACLQGVAAALTAAARSCGGVVARYGGEEFALLLPHQLQSSAGASVEEVRRAVSSVRAGGSAVTASAGWAFAPGSGAVSSRVLLERADAAALTAKAAGRDRAVAWSADLGADAAVV